MNNLNGRPSTEKVICLRLQKLETQRLWTGIFLKLAFILAIAWTILIGVFGFYTVKDDAMAPALREGDLVFYYRLTNEYMSGDVVVYKTDSGFYIGRITAKPGEEVIVTDDGELVINGYLQPAENSEITYPLGENIAYPLILGENEYFILSDNRESGKDSREFGAIKFEEIAGKLIAGLRYRNF